ncbi:NADH-quinone oxidoreductase subunit NuoN [Bacillus pseudomycoides]|uniref:NADH-quinone oxidoreductase subunit N n=2 Tax=Bacillaceae TaxID=186817 RepID=A0AA91VE20_9BACI|nr:NADH-quinone oxidoreductase subunit NuoN [Bacillus sp. AFS098217]PED83566.1 NADH-quinone oxidoreductase subunit NuoN [Bacillus pseudomycoides]PEU07643.1 NADH-quinone oxidoreductase subunit NuoN [Bacillus sp. AFS019443]PEU09217.1 NADH-quinone oxidoreductase subunit NuoN [Bacillus sp. AFS014408]PFW64059.1 NADH-quinone oxidoreductase subunit NuoN [Bacillus sp. AFS075034]
MDMNTLLSLPWHLMVPEFIVLLAAILLSLLDLFCKLNRKYLAFGAIGAVILSLIALIMLYSEPADTILNGSFVLDGFSKGFKTLLLLSAILILCMAISDDRKEPIQDKGEYYYLFLMTLLGAMFMASSIDFITLFIGLELLSLSSYILVGIRKRNCASNEAAMKYVINGGIGTAITLFGMSYLYGITGSTNIVDMQRILTQGVAGGIQLLLALSFLLLLVGLSFKIATVPFHMWAPDVYEGAATPVTAFLGTISKIAGFIMIIRLFLMTFSSITIEGKEQSLFSHMSVYIAVLAGITMIIGNIVALKQYNVKRLFAYSGIAHAGYLLVPLAALSPFTMDSMWFYILAYMLMNIGAFAVIHGLILQSGKESVTIFSGLYKRSPSIAVMMTIFILSLAGIPGTAGFIGKVNIFLGAFIVEPSHYILASVMMGTTVISFVYYFRILQQMFFRTGNEDEKIHLPINLKIVISFCAISIVILGILPAIGYNFFYEYFPLMKDFFFTGNVVQ